MKKHYLVLILLFLTSNVNAAQELEFILPDSISHSNNFLSWFSPNELRRAISLSGNWEYQLNKEKTWQTTVIPCISDFQGEITFRRSFKIDSSCYGQNFKLISYGINYYCTIFINKKFIGSHAGGYSSFSFDVHQSCVKVGQTNIIEVKVKTSLDAKTTIPLKNHLLGQKKYSGIYREIYLLALPKISVEISKIDYLLTENYADANIKVHLKIKNQTNSRKREKSNYKPGLRCVVELWEPESARHKLRETISINENDTLSIKLRLKKPQLWSPEFPNLYRVKVFLNKGRQVVDATSSSLGLKDLKVIKNDYYLNGQRLVLRGINWYEDYAYLGKLLLPANMEEIICQIKELNANAVRVVGHPPHPYWVDLCDRYGLFLLEELPIFHVVTTVLESEQYWTRASDYFADIILRDQHHVSILAWGIGSPYDSTSNKFLTKFFPLAEQLDNKPVYSNDFKDSSILSPQISGIEVFDINKELLTTKILNWQEKNDHKLTIVTSFGAPVKEKIAAVGDPLIFQEIQILKIVEAWRAFQHFQKIDGYFLNSLTDWQCEYPLIIYGPRAEPLTFPSGLVDYNGNKRLAFNTVRTLYSGGKININPGLGIKLEPPAIFPLLGVISLLIFLFIYNTRRYVQENLKRIFIHPHGFFVDLRDKRKIPISHTLLIAILEALGVALIGATFCYFYKENVYFDHLLTLLSLNFSVKEKLILLCWKPEIAILIFGTSFLIAFSLLAVIIKIFAIIFRKKYTISQSLIAVYWVGVNFLVLIPIGMVLYRVWLLESFFIPTLILLTLIGLWFLVRLIKALQVIYVWTFLRATAFVVMVALVIIGCIFYYYQKYQNILDYINIYIDHLVMF